MNGYKLKIICWGICLFFSPVLHAQRDGITIKMGEVTLDKIFQALEEISGYTFLYSDDEILQSERRFLDYRNADIGDILKDCLKGTGMTYVIVDRTVILKPLRETTAPELSADSIIREYIVVEGWVKAEGGAFLPGVNILIKNYPGIGIVTDENGYFQIKVRRADVLIFSYVGYRNKEVWVRKFKSKGVIVLKEESTGMDEVQVVGYGSQRMVTVTGAISTMEMKDRNFPVTSFSNMIAGNVAGIIGVQRSGEPGQDVSEFWVRGISTFGANDKALILIDGVERTTFNDLVAEDIAGFSVLKDASATAVYGARGANGVVMIETKRGMPGQMKINASARMMVSYLPRMPEYLGAYDYACLANEAREVRGEAPVYDSEMFEVIRYGLDPDLFPDVNWQKEMLKKWTLGAQVNLNMSGGGDIARYYVGLNYKTNDAAYKESGLNRYHTNVLRKQYSFRTNVDLNITPSTVVGVGMATTLVDLNRPGIGITDTIWAAQAALTPLTVPVRYSTGHAPAYGKQQAVSPAVLLNETGYVNEFQNNMEFKVEIRRQIVREWSATAAFAYDMTNRHHRKREKMPELFQAIGRDGKGELLLESVAPAREMTYTASYSAERRLYLETKTEYAGNWGDHRIGGLVLFNLSQYSTTEAINEISSIPRRTMGMAGRMTYSYGDIYLTEFNFGYNGTENFPKGKRFCFFPSLSAGWVVSGYPLVQEKWPGLRLLKMRYSFGVVGNDQIEGLRFPYLTYLSASAPGYGFGDRGEVVKEGLAEATLGAGHLIWEKSFKHNWGLDLNLFGKVQLNLDHFSALRKNIFMPRKEIPDMAGWPSVPYGNVGKMRSWGWDGTLSYRDKVGKIGFEFRGNFTVTNNKVLDYDESDTRYEYQRMRGKSLNQARGYIALGYFRDSAEIVNSPVHSGQVRPGDLKYKDVNGDGLINEEDRVPIGNSTVPRIQYGLAGSLNWKNWDIGVFFRGAGAVNFFYGGMGYFPFVGGLTGNILKETAKEENRWIPAWYSGKSETENPRARYSRLSYGENRNNFVPSTHWLANGAYLRLKTVEVGYSFSLRVLQAWKIKRLRLSLMGDNLRVWDRVHDWDPEQASSNGAVYPLTRSWIFNLQVDF